MAASITSWLNSSSFTVLLAVFINPMILASIPGFDQCALRGFEVIQKMPQWYRWIIVGMVIVIYGMRGMFDKFISSRLPNLK